MGPYREDPKPKLPKGWIKIRHWWLRTDRINRVKQSSTKGTQSSTKGTTIYYNTPAGEDRFWLESLTPEEVMVLLVEEESRR